MKLSVPQRFFGPRAFFACVLAISLVQILAIDMYAPALPSMQETFGVSELYLNNTVFSFLFASTLTMVFAGPVSDRFGRKPVLLAGCFLFTLGSLSCALAPNVEVLVAARAVEAVGYGVSAVLGSAMCKDSFEGRDLKLTVTLLQSFVIIGPVAAPFLGSFAVEHVGWRGVFWALSAGGALSVALACLLGETYRPTERGGEGLGATLTAMARDARGLVSQRSFTALALFIGVTGIPFFAFIAVSSYILLGDFQMDYMGYSFIYAGACLVNLLAPFAYMRLANFWDTAKVMRLVIALVVLSAVLLASAGTRSAVLLLLAFAPYALGEGIARPAAYLVLLDQPPNVVGTASALGNFSYGVLTSLATVAAAFPWPSFTFGLTALTALSAAVAFALYRMGSYGWKA